MIVWMLAIVALVQTPTGPETLIEHRQMPSEEACLEAAAAVEELDRGRGVYVECIPAFCRGRCSY